MRCYRLLQQGSASGPVPGPAPAPSKDPYAAEGLPATPLWFLDRNAALRYQKTMLWPWEVLGYFMMPETHERIPLGLLKLKVDSVTLPAWHDPALDWVCWRQQGVFGYSPVVPGRCFDPKDWRVISDHDKRDPILAPKIAEAERSLEEALKHQGPED